MHAGSQALANQLVALGDKRRVPVRAVLLVEGNQFAACRNPGGPAGLGEEHQREQPGHLAVVWQRVRIRRVSRIASAVSS